MSASSFVFSIQLLLFSQLLDNSRSINITQPCYYHNKTLPITLSKHQMAYFNDSNTIYIFGGDTGNATNDDIHLSTIYKWNVSNKDSWFELINGSTTPTSVFISNINNVVTIGNKAYCIGLQYYDYSIYIFDSSVESFIDTTNLTKPLYSTALGCITTNKTHIFIVGGYGDIYLQIYDIEANKWTAEDIDFQPINGANGYSVQYCQLINDVLFVFGGYIIYGTDNIYSNSYCKYELKKKIWHDLGHINSRKSDGDTVYYDSHILIIGGGKANYGSSIISNIDTFNINNQQFGKTYYMIDAVRFFASFIVYDKLYIFGGENNLSKDISSVQVCHLSSESNRNDGIDNKSAYTVIIIIIILSVLMLSVIILLIIRKVRRPYYEQIQQPIVPAIQRQESEQSMYVWGEIVPSK